MRHHGAELLADADCVVPVPLHPRRKRARGFNQAAELAAKVDVVLDVVGGDYLDRNVDALAVGGTIVQVGAMGGGRATFGLGKLLPKRATIVGTVLRARSLDEKVALSRAFADEIVPRFEDGTLSVVVDRRFDLTEIAAAHLHMEGNANVGKIALDVRAG